MSVKANIKDIYHKYMPEAIQKRRRDYMAWKAQRGLPRYEDWITELESHETYDESFSYQPKISVLVPVYNVLDRHLIPCIESVIHQLYTNWELCLVDDCSTWDNVKKTLERYADHDRIRVIYREENGHISRATNTALFAATGEFVAFLDCDDVLRPNALYEVVRRLNRDPGLDFIYSDEDKIDDDGKNRHMPHFKPDWSPDTLMSHMYTCHLGVYRTQLARAIGGLRPGFEGAQDYDFTLRFTEQTDRIAHIPQVLYHWRERAESTSAGAGAKPYVVEAGRRATEDAVKRRGLKADLELVDVMFQYRPVYRSSTNPLVSIIIPSKDNYPVLKRCLDSLAKKTAYTNYEILLVDNGSSEENRAKYEALCAGYHGTYLYEPMPFNFSKMCNLGAARAKGSLYLFLNDDIEAMEPDWLGRMVGHAELPHAGAVGAKLYYPGGDTIQHLGVINILNGPIHPFAGSSDSNVYYFGRNLIDYNYLAVTAACLMVGADKFRRVGGFDENLAVAYNDVDLCFSLVEAGYFNVARNDIRLYHHESVSRGNDLIDEEKFNRLMREQEKLYRKHPKLDKRDPFYNIHLSQRGADFSYNYTNETADGTPCGQ